MEALLLLRPRLRHLLLLLLLPKKRRTASNDLPDAHLEVELAVLGETRRRRVVAERELLRHREAIFAAFLHLRHRFGKAGKDLVHRERLRSPMIFAAVENAPVIGSQDIIHERGVGASNRLTAAGFQCAELEAALGDGRPERASPDPGEANSRCDEDEKADPQRNRASASIGSMGAFSDGHSREFFGCRELACALALGTLALELASAADRRGAFTGALLRRLFIMTAQLHLAVDAFALLFLLERAQRLLDIVVANDDLHTDPSHSLKALKSGGWPQNQQLGKWTPARWQQNSGLQRHASAARGL